MRGPLKGGGQGHEGRGNTLDPLGRAHRRGYNPLDEASVFEAVDRQLGLKLEEQKHPVQLLVVDKVERLPLEK